MTDDRSPYVCHRRECAELSLLAARFEHALRKIANRGCLEGSPSCYTLPDLEPKDWCEPCVAEHALEEKP